MMLGSDGRQCNCWGGIPEAQCPMHGVGGKVPERSAIYERGPDETCPCARLNAREGTSLTYYCSRCPSAAPGDVYERGGYMAIDSRGIEAVGHSMPLMGSVTGCPGHSDTPAWNPHGPTVSGLGSVDAPAASFGPDRIIPTPDEQKRRSAAAQAAVDAMMRRAEDTLRDPLGDKQMVGLASFLPGLKAAVEACEATDTVCPEDFRPTPETLAMWSAPQHCCGTTNGTHAPTCPTADMLAAFFSPKPTPTPAAMLGEALEHVQVAVKFAQQGGASGLLVSALQIAGVNLRNEKREAEVREEKQ